MAAFGADAPRPAPALNMVTARGERLSLSEFRGKVVVLKFFLTDCAHCQRTAGVIMPIYRELRTRGLEVIGVAINPDALQRVPEFVQRFGVTYPVTLGTRSTLTTFADLSAVARFYVPYIFMIDRQGTIRYVHPGDDKAFYDNEARNMRAEIEQLLKEPAQARKATKKTPAS
jgi:peroxiredoxin